MGTLRSKKTLIYQCKTFPNHFRFFELWLNNGNSCSYCILSVLLGFAVLFPPFCVVPATTSTPRLPEGSTLGLRAVLVLFVLSQVYQEEFLITDGSEEGMLELWCWGLCDGVFFSHPSLPSVCFASLQFSVLCSCVWLLTSLIPHTC